MSISIRKALPMLASALVVGGVALLTPHKAEAWWVRGGCCWGPRIVVGPPVVVAPPVVYAPSPYYAPAPYYAPRRFWVPGHYQGPYWVPGHWA
jgi:hypothetical protein